MPLARVTRFPGAAAQSPYGIIPITPPSVPGRPIALTVQAVSYNSATLAFAAPLDGGMPTGYRARYATDPDGPWSDPVTITASPAIVPLPAADTLYYVQVAAINTTGLSAWSDSVSLTTAEAPQPPAPPTVFGTSNVRRTSFVPTWVEPGGAIIERTDRRYRVAPSLDWITETGVSAGSALSGFPEGATVEWGVRFSNSIGDGAWSATQSTALMAPFSVPAVAGLADWRNMMESVEAARINRVTGAAMGIVGSPVMTENGARVKGGTDYFTGVAEALTQTVYVVGKHLAAITGSGNRPILVGSRKANADMGIAIYSATNDTSPSASALRFYAGFEGGLNRGVSPNGGSGTVDMSGLTILRGHALNGVEVFAQDVTHGVSYTVPDTRARALSTAQPLLYGSDQSGSYLGECVLACVVVVNGVPTTAEHNAIVAKIRSEMAYWGVAEGD